MSPVFRRQLVLLMPTSQFSDSGDMNTLSHFGDSIVCFTTAIMTEPESLHDSFNTLLIKFYQSNSGGFGLLVLFGTPPFMSFQLLVLGWTMLNNSLVRVFLYLKKCV